jgi:hypothetical protein
MNIIECVGKGGGRILCDFLEVVWSLSFFSRMSLHWS